jgi:hypothetical protein
VNNLGNRPKTVGIFFNLKTCKQIRQFSFTLLDSSTQLWPARCWL